MDAALIESTPSLLAATATAWNLPAVKHGFMGRRGGVSSGPYATFNLAGWIGDSDAAVAENWQRWHSAYPGMRVASVNQVHGNAIRFIDDAYDGAREPADGMVTATAGIALGIFSADCVPVLLIDPGHRVAGALHAGWRGTLADISAAGVNAMVGLGAERKQIRAALGPSIGPCCFEVEGELAERFVLTIPAAAAARRAGRAGKAYLDLRRIIGRQLAGAGLEPAHVSAVGACTRCANDRYFSRRAAQGATTGLQMSFIGFDR